MKITKVPDKIKITYDIDYSTMQKKVEERRNYYLSEDFSKQVIRKDTESKTHFEARQKNAVGIPYLKIFVDELVKMLFSDEKRFVFTVPDKLQPYIENFTASNKPILRYHSDVGALSLVDGNAYTLIEPFALPEGVEKLNTEAELNQVGTLFYGAFVNQDNVLRYNKEFALIKETVIEDVDNPLDVNEKAMMQLKLVTPMFTAIYRKPKVAKDDYYNLYSSYEHGFGVLPLIPITLKDTDADNKGESIVKHLVPVQREITNILNDLRLGVNRIVSPALGIPDIQNNKAIDFSKGFRFPTNDNNGNNRPFFLEANFTNIDKLLSVLVFYVTQLSDLLNLPRKANENFFVAESGKAKLIEFAQNTGEFLKLLASNLCIVMQKELRAIGGFFNIPEEEILVDLSPDPFNVMSIIDLVNRNVNLLGYNLSPNLNYQLKVQIVKALNLPIEDEILNELTSLPIEQATTTFGEEGLF